ncbi:MAG: hypothetical protein K2Y01_03380 [Rhabdochlamydiaceae bacterium]|nr:hypothetical protein [Rhabdochlamydiaceae bacterium]
MTSSAGNVPTILPTAIPTISTPTFTPTAVPTAIPILNPENAPPINANTGGQSPAMSYSDIEKGVNDFFQNWICNPKGGSQEICTGASTWFSGASAIGQVISGTFGMTYGTYQMVKGSVLLPFRALNAATGGFFFGLETATGAAGKMGVIGGAAWLVTSPIRLLNFVIGGVVGTINTLHDNTLLGGKDSVFPRISPLNLLVIGTILYFCLSGSSEIQKPSSNRLIQEAQTAKLQRQLERMEAADTTKKKKSLFGRKG